MLGDIVVFVPWSKIQHFDLTLYPTNARKLALHFVKMQYKMQAFK